MIESVKKAITQSRKKAIPYSEFISYALYDSTEGYYKQKNDTFGKKGDFYTSSHVHEVFSEVIGELFIQFFDRVNIPPIICELGGGDGTLATQICKMFSNKGIKNVTYYFIEENEVHRNKIHEIIGSMCRVETFDSLQEFESKIGHFNGIIFSNEFFDAQPIHVVEKSNVELLEVFVSMADDGTLYEESFPCSNYLKNWIEKYSITLTEGQRIEIPIYLDTIIKQISSVLNEGLVVTFDYGYTNEEWLDPRRKNGSVRGYLNHHLYEDILRYVGQMDITHHIHWDPFIKIGEEYKLELYLLEKQKQFLLKTGILNHLRVNESGAYFSKAAKKNRAIQQLISGDLMGNMFDVCIQSKGIKRSNLDQIFIP